MATRRTSNRLDGSTYNIGGSFQTPFSRGLKTIWIFSAGPPKGISMHRQLSFFVGPGYDCSQHPDHHYPLSRAGRLNETESLSSDAFPPEVSVTMSLGSPRLAAPMILDPKCILTVLLFELRARGFFSK